MTGEQAYELFRSTNVHKGIHRQASNPNFHSVCGPVHSPGLELWSKLPEELKQCWDRFAQYVEPKVRAYGGAPGGGKAYLADETLAKEIYEKWKNIKGWVPWVEGGNSDMQYRARQLARMALAQKILQIAQTSDMAMGVGE